MTDKNDFEFDGPNGERIEGRAIQLGGGAGPGAAMAALLAGALFGGLGGKADDGKHDDHPLLRKLGVEPPAPFRAATTAEFLAFFKGWPELKVGDIVEVREGYSLDQWPTKGERAIVSQVLETPIRRGAAFTEQMGRRNDVALIFVQNTDAEVLAAMAEAGESSTQRIYEFLYDSRRLKKVGNVFE